MGCERCDYTGIAYEYDETVGPGYVDIACPECCGADGEEPDIVTEGHDALTQAEIDEAWRQYAEGQAIEPMSWSAMHGIVEEEQT